MLTELDEVEGIGRRKKRMRERVDQVSKRPMATMLQDVERHKINLRKASRGLLGPCACRGVRCSLVISALSQEATASPSPEDITDPQKAVSPPHYREEP